MRSARVVLTMFLIGVLFGCPKQAPPVDTIHTLATASGLTKGEVDIEFRGLVASVIIPSKASLESVFLNPGGEEHKPLVSISTEWIDNDNATDPDFVATGDLDTGLAVWEFTEASIDPSNVSDPSLSYDAHTIDPMSPNYDLLLWVPSMNDIFGSVQRVDKTKIDGAAARGQWNVGTLTPIFDRDVHKSENWTIGSRKATPVADGVRLRLKLKDDGKPLVLKLKLKRTGTEKEILVTGGGTILMSAYPTTLPKLGEDLKHFHHFFSLIKFFQPTSSTAHGPSAWPARCPPGVFIPDEDPS